MNKLKLFIGYADEDKKHKEEFEKQLAPLKREGLIETWSKTDISAGEEPASKSDLNLEGSNIMLFLISPDFLASDYNYDVEFTKALEKHRKKEATLIPVIVRDCNWEGVLGTVQVLPKVGGAVSSSKNKDETWKSVCKEIKNVCLTLNKEPEKSVKVNDKKRVYYSISGRRARPFILFFFLIATNLMLATFAKNIDISDILSHLSHLSHIFSSKEANISQNDEKKTSNIVTDIRQLYKRHELKTYDNSGNRVEYIVYIIKGFNWKLGTVLDGQDRGEDFDICNYMSKSGIESRLNKDNLKAVICFGNSSYEESSKIPKHKRLRAEETRAETRASELAKCVNEQMKLFTPIYTLNLGKHKKYSKDSKWQRQIIIIGLVSKDEYAVEEEALYNGLIEDCKQKRIDINVNDYSMVDIDEKCLYMEKEFN